MDVDEERFETFGTETPEVEEDQELMTVAQAEAAEAAAVAQAEAASYAVVPGAVFHCFFVVFHLFSLCFTVFHCCFTEFRCFSLPDPMAAVAEPDEPADQAAADGPAGVALPQDGLPYIEDEQGGGENEV